MRAAAIAWLAIAPALVAEERPGAAPDPREDLAPVEQALSLAADRVARPNLLALTGADCRGYRIEGVGAVFVLPPRAVRSRNAVVWRVPEGRPGVAPRATRDREIRVIELQAEELQREAARTHAEVERALAEVQREVERRRAVGARRASASAPAPPAPPAAPAPPEPPDVPEAPEAAAAPMAPLPPSPPWTLWFESAPSAEDEVPADAVVARMRAALVEALAEHAVRLHGLRAEETVAAAIDFVPSFPFGQSRPERTLVLRVRKRDLDERRSGRIAPEQLRARIEVAEY